MTASSFSFALPAAPEVSIGSSAATVGVAEQRWWGDDHDGWGGGGWLFMMGFMVFFWVAVALVVIWVVRSWGPGRPPEAGGSGAAAQRTPLEIARERYARGEINDDEFERIKAGLNR